ncbi:hypothetical protein RchiOBHm_Chr3g0462221 [Rosa chinensis]|uniref:Uncharacterized protein n=1 Tax=Rosa chinensis TaxID=74649 RepID=A0A2P6R8V5_ROSCH|nr:hypothetical protein RchiOBHm_Chr3g0462221 [Rosa chinensis]
MPYSEHFKQYQYYYLGSLKVDIVTVNGNDLFLFLIFSLVTENLQQKFFLGNDGHVSCIHN